jgi:hypothetical protein
LLPCLLFLVTSDHVNVKHELGEGIPSRGEMFPVPRAKEPRVPGDPGCLARGGGSVRGGIDGLGAEGLLGAVNGGDEDLVGHALKDRTDRAGRRHIEAEHLADLGPEDGNGKSIGDGIPFKKN